MGLSRVRKPGAQAPPTSHARDFRHAGAKGGKSMPRHTTRLGPRLSAGHGMATRGWALVPEDTVAQFSEASHSLERKPSG